MRLPTLLPNVRELEIRPYGGPFEFSDDEIVEFVCAWIPVLRAIDLDGEDERRESVHNGGSLKLNVISTSIW